MLAEILHTNALLSLLQKVINQRKVKGKTNKIKVKIIVL
jgi:hypothetical protein